jgi:LysM repeat protein
MQAKRSWLVVMLCAVLAATFAFPALPAQAQGGGQNLLVDGDFEAPPTWPMQDGIGEVQVAPGWRAWYLDRPPAYVQKPSNCGDKPDWATDCYWMRPEFRDNIAASFENRVHSGVRSQKYFSYGRMHEAGLYQQVGGIRPGTTLRFAISIQAWQCYNIDKCGKNGIVSDAPADMHLRVGIDPYGGANPFSPNIVWSPEQEAFDRWVEFEVKAVARGDTVTVFTHSRPEWTWARQSNDVYLDDASLTVADGRASSVASAPASRPVASVASILLPQWQRWGQALDDLYLNYTNLVRPAASSYVAPAAPSPAATQTLTTTVPAASGEKRTYVVVEGDTLYLIAQRFNTTIQALMQANQITDADMIYWGLTLIIP